MAAMRWGDNIVVIGDVDKHGTTLDTVIIYNVETEQSHMRPSMRCKRQGCIAVVIENNIVVLGTDDEQENDLNSVEGFKGILEKNLQKCHKQNAGILLLWCEQWKNDELY